MSIAVFAPGAVTAGNNITLPDGFEDIKEIISVTHLTPSDGTNAATVTSPTATLVDERTFTLSEATVATSILIVVYNSTTEYPAP